MNILKTLTVENLRTFDFYEEEWVEEFNDSEFSEIKSADAVFDVSKNFILIPKLNLQIHQAYLKAFDNKDFVYYLKDFITKNFITYDFDSYDLILYYCKNNLLNDPSSYKCLFIKL